MWKLSIPPVAAIALGGCVTVGGMRSMPVDRGTERRFDGELEAVVVASRNALVATGLAIVEFEEVSESVWSMIATGEPYEKKELVRVVCERVGRREVAVRVITRRREPIGDVLRGDWSATVLAQVDAEMRHYRLAP